MLSSPLYLLSYVFSTTLVFFTTALAVHSLIYFFRFRNYRTRYLLRLLPFGAIILDLLAFEFGISNWINPLSCSSCTQKIILDLFFPDFQEYLYSHKISLLSYLNEHFYFFAMALMVLFVGISTLLLVPRVLQIIIAHYKLKFLVRLCFYCVRPIQNKRLQTLLELRDTKIACHNNVLTPMATPYNTIILPPHLNQFSQDEFDAIIAHEYEHIYWKDPQVKALLFLLKSALWWIPLNFWMKKIDEDQEMAADQGVMKHQLSGEYLASALFKFAVQSKEKAMNICYLAKEKSSSLKRVMAIMNQYPKDKFSLVGLLAVILGLAALVLCFLT